ncbi:hypothetical protein BH24ACT5_BH24ACT5_31860 [soil metagenome]
MPRGAWVRLESVGRRATVERFLRQLDQQPGSTVGERIDVYRVAADLIAREPVAYLEFGVHEGASMRFFSERLRHAEARLHGFDSFEGLPEHWNAQNPQGHFDTDGRAPTLEDDRAEFHVGWFEQTLSEFVLDRRGPLLVNIDCDLYSSTMTVLTTIGPSLEAGDLVYFDEFADICHEYRACKEYVSATGIELAVIARSGTWNNVLFRVQSSPRPASSPR